MERPNILVILTDQQSAHMMGCTGNPHVSTPALDSLAAMGTRFERAYCTNPTCVPSRFSLMTGRLPSEIGLRDNDASVVQQDALAPIRSQGLGWLLKEAGYVAAYGGKQHLPGFSADELGFDILTLDERDALAEVGAQFIRQERDKPFFLVSSFINPHDICMMAIRDHARQGEPEAEWVDAWRRTGAVELQELDQALELPEGMSEDTFFDTCCPPLPDNFDIPQHEPEAVRIHQHKRRFKERARMDYSEKAWRMHRWAYARLTERVDGQIGVLLDALRESGKLGDTVILFTSDHGDMDGAHRMEHKEMLYEEACRIPLILSHAGRTAGGRVDDVHLVSNGLDMIVTLAEYAGLSLPGDLRGRSLKGLAEGVVPGTWREAVPVEGENGRALITNRFKYVLYDAGENREQLHDLWQDPGEMENAALDASHGTVLTSMRDRFRQFFPEKAVRQADLSGITAPGEPAVPHGTTALRELDFFSERTSQLWVEGSDRPNDWVVFRRRVSLSRVPDSVPARMAVDSKYWLYVNGQPVVFEGGLNRESLPGAGWFDEVDLSPYLLPGENVMAVLVWYWGNGGRNSVDSGAPGFLLEAPAIDLFSDAAWLALRHPAYGTVETDRPSGLYGGHSIRFDAGLDIGAFWEPGFDGSRFQSAVIRSAHLAPVCRRPVPPLAFSQPKPYVRVTRTGTTHACSLPYHAHLTACLQVRATGGEVIDIRTDRYGVRGGPGGEQDMYNGLRTEYRCRSGEQSFEALAWMSGETVLYDIPESVEVLSLSWRESGYDAGLAGSFRSGDPFFDKLWDKAARTLKVCMRDNFMDCPDRERGQWIGDVSVQVPQVFLALERKADALVRKAILDFLLLRHGDVLVGNVPGAHASELPSQSLCAIGEYGMVAEWYRQTGDREMLRLCLEPAVAYLRLWNLDADGLVARRSGDWYWFDHLYNVDERVLENAWYVSALRFAAYMAQELDEHIHDTFLAERLATIEANFHRVFWQGHAYSGKGAVGAFWQGPCLTPEGAVDDRANAMAVLAGLAPAHTWPAIRKVLRCVTHSTPYMEGFVLEALCRMGHVQDALDRMKARYRSMVESPDSTLWEDFHIFGTHNHAWSGAPLTILSRHVAGIRLDHMKDGILRIAPARECPCPVHINLPTRYGNVSISLTREDGSDRIRVTVNAPEGLTVVLD